MTTPPITSELVEAFSQCKRKAFFLLHGQHNGVPHDLDLIIGQRAELHRDEFLSAVVDHSSDIQWNGNGRSKKRITSDDLSADCDVVVTKQRPSNAHAHLEPYLVVGTHSITSEQKLRLAFAGHVLGNANRYRPKFGFVVPLNNHPRRIQLERIYPQIYRIVNGLRRFRELPSDETPPLFLNEHCSTCPFRSHCLQEAEQHDNLTLLDRVTPKVAQKYRKKGIFTVEQLSYVFKPRRRRKRPEPTTPSFNVELRALAVRAGKIYLHQTPSIPRGDVELFLDIEGIPDQKFDYLIGLVIKDHEQLFAHSFWADSPAEEHRIFQECREIAAAYADAPIFHYGSYETKAFARATKQYGVASLDDRLVNVNSFIFGKVYFPTRSNSLKDIGRYIGAEWTTPGASGLKSLVWRYRWEQTQDPEIKKTLLEYNRNDCHAVHKLVEVLRTISDAAADRSDVEFADSPKQMATPTGEGIHREFDRILKSGHFEYQRNRIHIRRGKDTEKTEKKKGGPRKGCRAIDLRNIRSKTGKIVTFPRKRKCPRHKSAPLDTTDRFAEQKLIDLVFTKNGCRKSVTRYVGRMGYCPRCRRDYRPNAFCNFNEAQVFGRRFRMWAVYQRIALRLPLEAISQQFEDLFGEVIGTSTITNFIARAAEYYETTGRMLTERILSSQFVHADETKISVRGTDHYVWVLTDGE
ncbi:MAG: TM0106 family RecB-like putative nuclease, partial [Planctomycetes bacterium]|nr:TM0106 family RecB-like putative nuclease [Planctomycetota bacterium]